MRSFLTAFVDSDIVVHTVETFRPRGASALAGTLLGVDDTTLRVRTREGERFVALAHIVAFRPRDPSRLPRAIGELPMPATKTEVLEQWAAVNAALKAREPEDEVRRLLGRVIRNAERLLARRDDAELAVARERALVILGKCSDPSLPPEE